MVLSRTCDLFGDFFSCPCFRNSIRPNKRTLALGYAHFSSYATGYGSHAPHFGGPFTPVFVGYAQKSEIRQLVGPFIHRSAKLWSSCDIFVLAVFENKEVAYMRF